jgi:four helix bundle protein
MRAQDISDRLLEFAVRMGKVVDALPETRIGRHVAGQLVRCGTSPAPNYEEACAAESPADFVHKLRVCLKELRESRMWLAFIIKSEMIPVGRVNDLLDECEQLAKIIAQSIVTSKRNAKKKS